MINDELTLIYDEIFPVGETGYNIIKHDRKFFLLTPDYKKVFISYYRSLRPLSNKVFNLIISEFEAIDFPVVYTLFNLDGDRLIENLVSIRPVTIGYRVYNKINLSYSKLQYLGYLVCEKCTYPQLPPESLKVIDKDLNIYEELDSRINLYKLDRIKFAEQLRRYFPNFGENLEVVIESSEYI